jgi:hypothetical protein
MAIEDVRAAFLAASPPGVKLHDATMRYDDAGRQILGFTGWHTDGTPFAFASAPFAGNPAQRAAEIAIDLMLAHSGTVPAPKPTVPLPSDYLAVRRKNWTGQATAMPTPPINGLAATLREQLKAATARADAIAAKAKDSVGNLHAVLDTAEATVKQVDAAAADIQSALGMSNGGPPLEPEK